MMNDPISFYQQRLNLPVASFSLIDHEEGMVAIVYKVTQPVKDDFILKICDSRSNYLREVHFLSAFADQLPVPRIIQLLPPDKESPGAILMECLPGGLLQPKALTAPLAYEIGRSLALIHLNRLPGYGDPISGHLADDPRTYFTMKFDEGIAECKDNLPLALLDKCCHYYETHLDSLMSVDGPCIAHRDFRPGNLIIDEGKLRGIIDWAGARASFAEEDFCSFEHGEWSITPKNKVAFLAGYATVRPIPDYQQIMPFLRLNKALATLGCIVKRRTWDNKHAALYRFNRGVLETLFKD